MFCTFLGQHRELGLVAAFRGFKLNLAPNYIIFINTNKQKADRDEKESVEKAKQEEVARREADRAKREYQAQLAQEVIFVFFSRA